MRRRFILSLIRREKGEVERRLAFLQYGFSEGAINGGEFYRLLTEGHQKGDFI
jgi:hypothetical protein